MKKAFILISALFVLISCTKKEPVRTSGTDTIDNITYYGTTYYTYGFSFSKAKLIPTSTNPGPDIAIVSYTDNGVIKLTLQANNLKPSFFKYGEFADGTAAATAFDNLRDFSASQWLDVADPVNPNQIWIYRSGSDTYTKFRIISTVSEIRQSVPYGEITFQWVIQPDGTTTFPPK